MSTRDELIIVLRRCCGAACEMAMNHLPSVSDPELRAAFTSWARAGEDAGPAPGRRAAGRGGFSAAVEVAQ